MSLRVRFLVVIGLLSSILLVGSIYQGTQSFMRLENSKKSLSANETAISMIDTERSMAVERGVTQGVMGAKKALPAQAETILKRREIVNGNIQLLNDPAVIDPVYYEAELAEMNALFSEIQNMRPHIDALIKQQTPVPSEVRTNWFPTATSLIRSIATFRHEIEVASEPSAEMSAFFNVRDRISSLTEILGQERGRLNGFIAADLPMFPNELVPVREITGMIDVRLSDVAALAKKLPDTYRAQVQTALDNYNQNISVMRENVVKAGQGGQDYPLDSSEWFKLTTDGILEFFKVADSLSESITLYTNEELSEKKQIMFLALGVVLLGIGTIIYALYVSQFQIQKPLDSILKIMGDLQAEKFDVEIPSNCKTSEMTAMYQALERFKTAGLENERYRIEQIELKKKSEEEQRALLLKVADDFEAAIGHVTSEVVASAEQLVSSASTVKQQADDSANRGKVVQEQAVDTENNVQSVAEAAKELEKAIFEISDKTSAAANEANEASNLADNAAQRVEELNNMSSQIQDVIILISDIADQTNMLALNATIEAARAGDAGKGFAVVASEVKNLANQTQKATSEISRQINGMLSQITETTVDVRTILQSISTMRDNVNAVAQLTETQSSTTQNIAVSMTSASERTGMVRGEVSTMAQSATDTTKAIAEVTQSANLLSNLGSRLEKESSSFLEKVRA